MTETPPKKGRKDWSEMSAGERIIGVVGLIVIVAVVVTIVIPGVQHWANASDASPAPTQEAAVATSTPARAPTPTAQETAWPAEFQDKFCAAIHVMEDAARLSREMMVAAATGDTVTVGDKAFAAGADAMTVDALLEQASVTGWEPAREVIRDMRGGLAVLIPALEMIDQAVQQDDVPSFTQGVSEANRAIALLGATVPATEALSTEHGFTCVR